MTREWPWDETLWMATSAALGVVCGLCVALALSVLVLQRRALRLWDGMQLVASLRCLDELLSASKTPDRLVLSWAGHKDFPPSFWDEFNLVYAEFKRCPKLTYAAYDFWEWGLDLASPPMPLELKDGESPFFDLTLVIPFAKLARIGLADKGEWRNKDDPDYSTMHMSRKTAQLLPSDRRRPSQGGRSADIKTGTSYANAASGSGSVTPSPGGSPQSAAPTPHKPRPPPHHKKKPSPRAAPRASDVESSLASAIEAVGQKTVTAAPPPDEEPLSVPTMPTADSDYPC